MCATQCLYVCVYMCVSCVLQFYSMDGQNAWANLGYLSLFVPVYAFLVSHIPQSST